MPRKRKPAEPAPEVPTGARRLLAVGVLAGLVCAEAMSAMRLYTLGRQADYPAALAWLVPAMLDIYALTMVAFSPLVPTAHPLRRKASREAGTALGITVACNALEEVNEAFAGHLPYWAPDILFVVIGSLAPFIAYRLIHFFAAVGNGQKAAAAADAAPAAGAPQRQNPGTAPVPNRTATAPTLAAPQRPPAPGASAAAAPGASAPVPAPSAAPAAGIPAAAPAPGAPTAPLPAVPALAAPAAQPAAAAGAVVYQLDDQRRVNETEWAKIAEPLYHAFMASNGRKPTANELAATLHDAGHPKFKDTRAKEIRRATERRINNPPQPAAAAPAGENEQDTEPEREKDAS